MTLKTAFVSILFLYYISYLTQNPQKIIESILRQFRATLRVRSAYQGME